MFRRGCKANYSQRCATVMLASSRAVRMDVGEIITKHAAEELLGSGPTIRRSISTFEKQTLSAVEQLQGEFAAKVEGRGREWKKAMQAIDLAIDGQLRSATHLLERPFTIAAGTPGKPAPADSNIAAAIEDELRAVGVRLRDQHKAFSEGWTAPLGKQWHERHPLIYGALSAIGGAAIAVIVGMLVK